MHIAFSISLAARYMMPFAAIVWLYHLAAATADTVVVVLVVVVFVVAVRFSPISFDMCSVCVFFFFTRVQRVYTLPTGQKELYHTQLLNFMLVLFNALF